MKPFARGVELYKNLQTGALFAQQLGFSEAGFLTHLNDPIPILTGNLLEAAEVVGRILRSVPSGTPAVYDPGLTRKQQRGLVKGHHMLLVVLDVATKTYTVTPTHRRSGGWIWKGDHVLRGKGQDLQKPALFAAQLEAGFQDCS